MENCASNAINRVIPLIWRRASILDQMREFWTIANCDFRRLDLFVARFCHDALRVEGFGSGEDCVFVPSSFDGVSNPTARTVPWFDVAPRVGLNSFKTVSTRCRMCFAFLIPNSMHAVTTLLP
jgi:hypothetical protein